jgi:hypothetical protein
LAGRGRGAGDVVRGGGQEQCDQATQMRHRARSSAPPARYS